jgi:glycosyltransferase involved in cell wall biosynthesis
LRSNSVLADDDFDVVIVTPTYLSSNPRVVKEADALARAGLRVCVVFSQGPVAWARADDETVTAGRGWRAHPVRWSRTRRGESAAYWRSTLRFHLARRLPFSTRGPLPVVLRAECRTFSELAAAAAEIKGRLYVGHYPEGLAAAAAAAAKRNAQFAYDVEDLHTGEDADTPRGRARSSRVFQIERRYIGACAYVSAVSSHVADAIAERYPGVVPFVVYNTFPWEDRASIDGETRDRRGPATSLYWQSQVIGFDRGLQDVVRALGRVEGPFQFHVRGWYTAEVAAELDGLARTTGVAGRMFLHPRVPPSTLLSRAVEHDIGLALEQPISANKMLTASNKLFFYLLAGLAVVATDTIGQRTVLQQIPGAGDLYPPGDVEALATILNRLMNDPALLARRRQAALGAASSRWNWETEQGRLVEVVHRVLKLEPRSTLSFAGAARQLAD